MTDAAVASNPNVSGLSDTSSSGGEPKTLPADAAPKIPSFHGTKHKIDFDGKEIELDYEDLVEGFKRTAKDSFTLRQQMEQLSPAIEFLNNLKKGDLSALRSFVDRDALRQFSEKELLEYIEEQEMDPREREFRQRESQLQAWEAQQKQAKEQYENQIRQQQMLQANEQVQSELVEAIKEIAGDMRVTPRFARRVAEQLYANLENERPVTARDAAKREWDELGRDYTEYQSTRLKKDPAGFLASLPPELIKAIREQDLATRKPFKSPEPKEDDSSDYGGQKKPVNAVDFWKKMDNFYDKKRKQRG